MLGLWHLLGETDARPRSNPELIWSTLALAALLLGGTAAILWVKRWRARLGQERPSAEDEIARYRGLLARGELSPEEFERITGVIRGQPAPPAPPAQDPPAEPPAPVSPGR
jgi:hypothetical protein